LLQNKSTVIVELPGLSKDKVNIALDNDRLTISGSSEEAKEYTDADKVTHKERSFGSFSRTMQVPPGTKAEDIKASMDQGLLKVELPNKKEDKSPKKITVN
jgi:HSP20 family protein